MNPEPTQDFIQQYQETLVDVNGKLSDQLLEGLKKYKENLENVSDMNEEMTLVSYHRPTLLTGTYKLKAHQTVQLPDGREEHTKFLEQSIAVSGPRFRLDHEEINSVFPAADSNGDYSHTLPQIVFNRASLPWELMPDGISGMTPWLCLVMFHGDEAPEVKKKALVDVLEKVPKQFAPKSKVNTISTDSVKLPEEYSLLGHTREVVEPNGIRELAYLFGYRLPKEGAINTVHLLSLKDKGKNGDLISLCHWSFHCKERGPDFKRLMEGSTSRPFRYYPTDGDNRYFYRGYVPLPHFMKDGRSSLSLYRGPLKPFHSGQQDMQNEISEWIDDVKMQNAGLVAAKQLGQLLTLSSRDVATAIYEWEHKHLQLLKCESLKKTEGSFELDISGKLKPFFQVKEPELPEVIINWLIGLLELTPVPFNYLVPYEHMLPEESIRFFCLDQEWVKNCINGAFSLEGVDDIDLILEKFIPDKASGFLLRNPVVGHYPEMEVHGTIEGKTEKTEILFQHHFGHDIWLCCFRGKLEKVKFFLPGQALFPGFEKGRDGLKKTIKSKNGKPSGTPIMLNSGLKDSQGYLKLKELNRELRANSSAEFAMQMLEPAPSITFNLLAQNP